MTDATETVDLAFLSGMRSSKSSSQRPKSDFSADHEKVINLNAQFLRTFLDARAFPALTSTQRRTRVCEGLAVRPGNPRQTGAGERKPVSHTARISKDDLKPWGTTMQFEVGKKYSARSACNYDSVWTWKVVRRTAKRVYLRNEEGKEFYCVPRRFNGGPECLSPLGRYSMSPTIYADKPAT